MQLRIRTQLSALAEIFILLIVLQCVRELLEWAVQPVIGDDSFYKRMTTMTIMCVLSVAVVLYARLRRVKLSVFPERFGRGYVILTVIAAVLLLSAPSNYLGGWQPFGLLLYGCIVTPIYEELLFRGYIWNRLGACLHAEKLVYLWSVLLFTIWHLGYMVPQLIAGNWSAVLWKLAAGAGYGAVLGLIRLKTRNCYATILIHGLLNLFMV